MTLDVERALNSDDGHGAVLARRAMAQALQPDLASLCPEPQLYCMLHQAAARWEAAVDPVHRQRWEGPCRALARAVHELAAETVRAHRRAAEDRAKARAGLPRGDR